MAAMLRTPGFPWTAALLAAGVGVALATTAAGCTAIAGITDGQLVEAGAPDGSVADGAPDGGTTDSAGVDTGADTGGCGAGSRSCDGGCVPIDVHNCAACGNDCTALPHVSSTGLACTGGACVYTCETGWGDCSHSGTGCTTSLTNASNCGACNAACTAGASALCQNGTCVTSCSGSTPDACGSTCTNTQTDPLHCGGCSSACNDTTPHSMATCSGGTCGFQCDATYSPCGNACVDEADDTGNCGSCGNTCTAPTNGTTSCSGGSCTSACPSSAYPDYCSTSNLCTNFASDSSHCGNCSTTCNNGTVCTSGLCACPAGWIMCSGTCVDIQGTDGANCGACGRDCQGAACSNGICQPTLLASASGYVDGIGVDSANVYFTNGAAGGVNVCPLGGCTGTPPVVYTMGGYAGHLVYDVPNGNLYVEDANAGKITAITTGGVLLYSVGGAAVGGEDAIDGTYVYAGINGGVQSFQESNGATAGNPFISLPGESADGVWYDATSHNLFVAAYGAPGEVLECSTPGGACTHVPGGSLFAGPFAITVQGGTLFFTADGTSAASYSNGGLFSAPVGDPTSVTAMITGAPYATGEPILAVTADSTGVYFAAGAGIYRCPLSGCGGAPAQVSVADAQSLTTDDVFLYFGSGTSLYRVAKYP